MNYKRLLSALLCVFFISVPQIAMTMVLEDEMSKAVDKAVADAGAVDAEELTEKQMNDLANTLAKITKGN